MSKALSDHAKSIRYDVELQGSLVYAPANDVKLTLEGALQ